MIEQFNYCQVVGRTDVGKRRAANEDSMGNAITINGLVSVVCDGMGGHVGGATASKIAVNSILDNLSNNFYDDPRIAIGESIDIANKAILKEAEARPELSGMGSTCVLLIVRGGKVYIGHVGDSRIYLIRSKNIIQLTKDHSYVQMLVDRGEITAQEAEHHPRKNEITNALGIPNMTPASVADDAIIPEAGDCFLLCSDGLSGMVPNNVINKIVSRQAEMNAQDRVNRLIELANENGGVDNITAQMVEFPVAPGSEDPVKKFPVWLKITIISVLFAAVLGIGLYFSLRKEPPVAPPAPVAETTQDTTVTKVPLMKQIKYSKDSELITIEFSENGVIFKHKNEQLYAETNVKFKDTSIQLETPGVNVVMPGGTSMQYVLQFTDKFPGDKVIFNITSDDEKVYRYTINITDGSSAIKATPEPSAKKSGAGTEAAKIEVKQLSVQMEVQIETGKRLLLNYSAKPTFVFDGKDYPSSLLEGFFIDEVKSEEIKYDKGNWKMVFNSVYKQLIFEYKGSSSSGKYSFFIPCVLRGSTEEIILNVVVTSESSDDSGYKPEDPSLLQWV